MVRPASAEDLRLVGNFYTTSRTSAGLLTDGGGPFGFDIHVAFQVQSIIDHCEIDGIVETGCCLGDTTEYLALQYPELEVRTCDIDETRVRFAARRLRTWSHVRVEHGDSGELLASLTDGLRRPLFILDAHGSGEWPLARELAQVRGGVAVIDDFDIGHPRFSFDRYDGIDCGPSLVARLFPRTEAMLVGNPYGRYPAPCLQPYRRAGRGYVMGEAEMRALEGNSRFCTIELGATPTLPPWRAIERAYVDRA